MYVRRTRIKSRGYYAIFRASKDQWRNGGVMSDLWLAISQGQLAWVLPAKMMVDDTAWSSCF